MVRLRSLVFAGSLAFLLHGFAALPLELLSDLVDDFGPRVPASLLFALEDLLEVLLVVVVVSSVLYLLLQSVYLLHIHPLFFVLFGLFVGLDCLVELLVLKSLLFLLESLDLALLVQQSTLNLRHVLISLQHLRKEVIWSANRHFSLH